MKRSKPIHKNKKLNGIFVNNKPPVCKSKTGGYRINIKQKVFICYLD